jgi:hypothetical protein
MAAFVFGIEAIFASENVEAGHMAPKKVAKKAAKKSAKHHDKKHHSGKDLRKAYEHMGRLTALQSSLPVAATKQIGVLTRLAEAHLRNEEGKSAAHLLRAGEHLAFGSLASETKASQLSEELVEAVHAEYEHLVDKADEHWIDGDERPEEITTIYEAMITSADVAFRKGAFRQALEFAHGAEALAHVKDAGLALDASEKPEPKKLKK